MDIDCVEVSQCKAEYSYEDRYVLKTIFLEAINNRIAVTLGHIKLARPYRSNSCLTIVCTLPLYPYHNTTPSNQAKPT